MWARSQSSWNWARAARVPLVMIDWASRRRRNSDVVVRRFGLQAELAGGGINGFASSLASYPDDDLEIAVLVNTSGNFADELAEAVAHAALGVARVAPADVPLTADEGAALAGRYTLAAAKLTLVVEVRDGKLAAHKEGDPASPLLRQPDGSFVAENGGRFVFHRDGPRASGFTYSIHGDAFEAARVA